MNHWNKWNLEVIEEFRAKGGRVSGMLEEMPLLLLHHIGARSGAERISPLAYQAVERGYAIFGSKGGAATNPDWYHNLLAHPEVSVEVGEDTIPVRARVTEGKEREHIWGKQKEDFPNFAEYEDKTSRQIPVIVLERR
jgi:deazaflavin-dependent oxidoreductase (nitroreductase family)